MSRDDDNNVEKESRNNRRGNIVTRFIGVVIGTLLLSILVELVFITFVYPDQGARHSIEVYLQEQTYIEKDYNTKLSLLGGLSPYILLDWFSDWINGAIFRGLNLAGVNESFGMQDGSYLSLLDDYAIAVGVVTCITLFRAAILILSLPVYALAFFAGSSYGVTRRDIRKYDTGRESSRRHYLARACILPSLYIPWVVYLSCPYAIHPAIVVVPTATVTFFSVRYTLEYFEKVF
ncbi:DUF4400 domain-containing protein [Vibrio tubiashii]|uniref:DUF4400 domain-containing protein n=1 Tax=Vibrio tubiashii TaxID=29498 RepID=UPI001EFE9774|nr:DUF4400 domain-containing protein [Vibrio tubiashii]MCG9576726.1 DUF4400 domain-containing protein [Vibrio tubiashii]